MTTKTDLILELEELSEELDRLSTEFVKASRQVKNTRKQIGEETSPDLEKQLRDAETLRYELGQKTLVIEEKMDELETELAEFI